MCPKTENNPTNESVCWRRITEHCSALSCMYKQTCGSQARVSELNLYYQRVLLFIYSGG